MVLTSAGRWRGPSTAGRRRAPRRSRQGMPAGEGAASAVDKSGCRSGCSSRLEAMSLLVSTMMMRPECLVVASEQLPRPGEDGQVGQHACWCSVAASFSQRARSQPVTKHKHPLALMA